MIRVFSVKTGLSGGAAKAQARYLARERERMLRAKEREELARLRGLLRAAQRRRREALGRAKGLCKRARLSVREQIRILRAEERARLNLLAANLRLQARTRCAQRKERIRTAGHGAAQEARRRVAAERVLQRQLRGVDSMVRRRSAALTTSKERRRESDDEVRSNLPPELHRVWERVKRTIKAGPRTTRTETFLEWAESNPGEVLALQYSDVDREVAALVAEHERLTARPKPRVSKAELRTLERVGLAKTSGEAKRRAQAGGVDDYIPF